MNSVTIVLGVIAMLILATSLFYTIRVGKLASDRHTKLDAQINKKVQEHPYLRNPVFLAYIFAGLIAFGYILYLAFTISW
jgi:hypothetical protein